MDADVDGTPILRRDTLPYFGNENSGIVDFAAGYHCAAQSEGANAAPGSEIAALVALKDREAIAANLLRYGGLNKHHARRVADTLLEGAHAAGAEQARQAVPSLSDEQIDDIAAHEFRENRLPWIGFKQDAEGLCTLPVVSKSEKTLIRACLAAMLAAAPGAAASSSKGAHVRMLTDAEAAEALDDDWVRHGDVFRLLEMTQRKFIEVNALSLEPGQASEGESE